MFDEMVPEADEKAREQIRALKQELSRAREESDREIERLRRELAKREVVSYDRAADSVADNLAVQQELDVLHRALREKDRTLDDLTRECRRLEDALEDRHLDFDALRKEIDRKDQALLDAQERLARLEQGGAPAPASTPVRGASPPRAAGPPRAPAPSLARAAPPSTAVRSEVPPPSPPRVPLGDSGVENELAPSSILLMDTRSGLSQLVLGLVAGVVVALLSGGFFLWQLGPEWGGSATDDEVLPEQPFQAADPLPERGPDSGPAVGPSVRDLLSDGSAGPLMIPVMPAVFNMGNPRGRAGSDAVPAHRVALGAYLIGATEVTFADFDRFVRATGGRFAHDFGWGRDRRPVVDVSFDEAQAYVEWLSRETGKHYRLPSEAEWEYAARGGRPSPYWWGFNFETNRAVCLDCGSNWDGRSTAPVSSFAPNHFGLSDTAGNVMEWVEDCYVGSYQGAAEDGRARTLPGCPTRVLRSGSFNRPRQAMRSFAREHMAPGTHDEMIGFRVARDAERRDE